MLLLATQLANETDMKRLLLSVLEALLESLDAEQSEIHTEAITLIRCIIRLVVKLMDESPANRYELLRFGSIMSICQTNITRPVLVPILIGHFATGRHTFLLWPWTQRAPTSFQLSLAKTLIERFQSAKRSTIVAKDISWLWRTAYNCAVQGCAEWENAEESVSHLFDVAQNVSTESQPGLFV